MVAFELNRYLDYCSEMLSLVSKIGALYVQSVPDRDALSAVDEIENLAIDPKHSELKSSLWAELEAKLKETGDPRTEGNGDIFESYEYIVDASHSWAHYIAGREEVEAAGGRVMALPLEPGYSTTGIVEEVLSRQS